MPRKQTKKQIAIAAQVNRLYEKSTPLLVGEGLLLIVAAILIFMRPVMILTALTFVIGVGLILFGLFRTFAGFGTSRNFGGGWMDVLFGLINIIIGVLFCVFPSESMVGVMYIFVVLFLFKALRALIFSINMVRARFGHYIFDLIMALFLVGLAVLLLWYPVVGAVAMMYYLGVTLLIYAGADVYMYIQLRQLKKVVIE